MALILMVLGVSLVFGDELPSRYHTYQEVFDSLTDLRDSHPQILYLDTLGFSTRDNIPMLRLKISDNPQIDEDEPAVFFDAGVHADEVLSVEVVMRFLRDIVAKYDSADPTVVNYIQQMEIFVIPFVNPEGHLVVEGGDLDWRKNKSDNDTNGVFTFYDGVDNNRNYDFGWDIDEEPDAIEPESLQYKGYAPFTETENIAMAAFGWQYRPIIAIDFHSPTYGRPNVAYYPWYWYSSDGGHGYGPDVNLMQSICQSYTSQILAIPDDSNTVTYIARSALVNKGDFKTYFYGNFGTAAFAVEISDTTIQNPALVDSIVNAHLPGLYYLLDRALGPGITGVIRDSVTLEPLEAEIQVLQHINDDINPRLSRPDFGRYHRVLASGTYTLRFIKDGYATKTINNVTVGSSSPTTTDVLLAPMNPVPPPPVLAGPEDNSILEDEYADFSWNQASTATGYVIEIANDLSFQTIVEFDSTISGLAYQNTGSFISGNYYWRVTAFNGNGYSGRSETWHFEIQLSPVPPIPVLLYPIAIAVDTSIVIFDWENSESADGYVYELAIDIDFLDIIEYDSTLTLSEYENSTLLGNGIYYWRVSAYNIYGYSDPSEAVSFAVELTLPVPVLLSPGEGFCSTTPYINFDWQANGGVDRYLIEIASDLNFTAPVIFDSTLAVSEYTNSDSLANGTYYWRVKAYLTPFWSDYCVPWEFYVEVDTSNITYIPGDVNNDQSVISSDVTYLVNFFRGFAPPPIEVNGFYPAADANGDCHNIGADVTYLVNFFRGGSAPIDGHCF